MGDVEREVHSARMLGCEISTNPLDPLEPILKMCEYHHPDEDISILERAYERAVKQHSSQRRKSGEPYIIHPIAVAYKLVEFGMDTPSNVKHWAVRNCRSLLSCIKIKQLNNSWIFLRVLIF